MWNLAKTFAIVAVCLATADAVSAVSRPQLLQRERRRTFEAAANAANALYQSGPFVGVTVTDEPLELGEVVGPGWHHLQSHLTAHVVANCPYHIEASFTGLRHGNGGKLVLPQHLTVAINGKETPVGTGRVTIAQSGRPTGPAGEDVPVDLQVGFMGLSTYPAGRYNGNLVLTIMAAP
ncbi:MAG: hypothetical protein JW993_06700 [Sedimentisphaerales bacterium]|nr:hypothetical protein [Sedimentisphaerales bacterium]